ncbi:MAG: OmpA family protein, partial [Bacteroidota bacterium]
VNTGTGEASPFYDAESGYLYFSSNGKTGMGGMDIFKISGQLISNQWPGPATNLGFPLNSVKDDLYYTKEPYSDTAYLSSDRASACCMELFKAIHLPYTDTLNRSTNNKNFPAIQNEPVNKMLQDSVTEENSVNRHLMDSINAVTIGRQYVNYNFASAAIRKADYPQLNSIIKMMEHNPALNILIASFTDCIGSISANILLSRKRSESVKTYLIKRGIDPSRINIDFFGKKYFIIACNENSSYNKEKQIANRRSDLIITNEQTPKWKPSGKELDNQEIPVDSSTISSNTGDKNKYGNNSNSRRETGYARALPESPGKPVAHMTVDSMYNTMKITELLDVTLRLKKPDIIEEMTRR